MGHSLFEHSIGWSKYPKWTTSSIDPVGAPVLDQGERILFTFVADDVMGFPYRDGKQVLDWRLSDRRARDSDNEMDGAALVSITTSRVVWRRRLALDQWAHGHFRYEWVHSILAGRGAYGDMIALVGKQDQRAGQYQGTELMIAFTGLDATEVRSLRNWLWQLIAARVTAWADQLGAPAERDALARLHDGYDPRADKLAPFERCLALSWSADGVSERGAFTSTNWEPAKTGIDIPSSEFTPVELLQVPRPLTSRAVTVPKVEEYGERPVPFPYRILALRSVGDEEFHLFPDVTDGPLRVATTAEDSTVQVPISIRELKVTTTVDEIGPIVEQGTLTITADRVTIAVTRWTKGSRWYGSGLLGATFAVGAMAVSAARAANERRGTILTGQVRYCNLVEVSVDVPHPRRPSMSITAVESVSEPNATRLVTLNTVLLKGANPREPAAHIAVLAAQRHLQLNPHLSEDDRRTLQQIIDDPYSRADQNEGAWRIRIPGALPVTLIP